MMYPEANLNGQFIQITPKKKHAFPLTPSGVWQGSELSTAGPSAANPTQWSWMGFRLHLPVFIRSYFLLEIKIVKTDHSFLLLSACEICSLSRAFSGVHLKIFIHLTNLVCIKAFLNCSTLRSSSSLRYVKPRNRVPTSKNTWTRLQWFHSHFASPLLSGTHMPINRERDVSICILE